MWCDTRINQSSSPVASSSSHLLLAVSAILSTAWKKGKTALTMQQGRWRGVGDNTVISQPYVVVISWNQKNLKPLELCPVGITTLLLCPVWINSIWTVKTQQWRLKPCRKSSAHRVIIKRTAFITGQWGSAVHCPDLSGAKCEKNALVTHSVEALERLTRLTFTIANKQ